MQPLAVELPDQVREYAEKAARQRGYASISAYIRGLVEADRANLARAELEASLVEALESPSTPFTDQDLDEIEREGLGRIEQRKQA